MSQLNLGGEIQHNGVAWRVVRLINDDYSLFENADGQFIIHDSYAMVKSVKGEIDFIIISSERLQYEGPQSTIKALENLPWRKHA